MSVKTVQQGVAMYQFTLIKILRVSLQGSLAVIAENLPEGRAPALRFLL